MSNFRTGRLNVERWETGKSRPYRANLHPLLRVARPLVDPPTAAGQFFNLAAAVVLPRLTRPAGTYRRSQIRELLVNPESDNSDLTDNLLDFFVSGEILTALDPEDSSEEAAFIPRIGVQVLDREREPWLVDLIAAGEKLSDADRKLWLAFADRLAEPRSP